MPSYNINGAGGVELGRVNQAYSSTQSINGVGKSNGRAPNGALTSKVVEGPAQKERPVWDNQIEFLLSCIAMSVGLGNVWRFPFTAYENGGGAFLIPYLIVLFGIGKPLYYLEMSLGQFSSYGQVKVWKLAPVFKGIGFGAMLGTACVVSYYTSLMALTIYYFVASFSSTLPWTICNKNWEGVVCDENSTAAVNVNKTLPELYYEKTVFPQYADVNNGIGAPDWRLTLCLFVSWLTIVLSLIKGVKSSGKVAYFTAIFPYVVLIILLIRGVTLEGAWEGIKYLLVFDIKDLLQPKVWFAAVTQCFFSLTTGFGPIIMFSSYNPFRHNVHRDAWIISIADTLTSLLASFTIFAILGHLALITNTPVENVLKSGGPSLAFISYPDAIGKFGPGLSQFFSVLFFLMLFTLGVGSATSLTGGIITILHDEFPKIRKSYVTVGICICGFLSGLIYVTPGGQFMLTLVDNFGSSFVIYVVVVFEVIAVSWVYGLSNISRDIEFMIGRPVGWYWKFCWGLFIPVFLTLILVYTFATWTDPKHNGVEFPLSAMIAGWVLFSSIILMIPICAFHTIFTRKADTFWGKIKEAFRPARDWGPKDAEIREEWLAQPPHPRTAELLKRNFQKIRSKVRGSS